MLLSLLPRTLVLVGELPVCKCGEWCFTVVAGWNTICIHRGGGTLILHIPYSTITVVKHLVEYGQCYQSGESEFLVVVVIREKSSILGSKSKVVVFHYSTLPVL